MLLRYSILPMGSDSCAQREVAGTRRRGSCSPVRRRTAVVLLTRLFHPWNNCLCGNDYSILSYHYKYEMGPLINTIEEWAHGLAVCYICTAAALNEYVGGGGALCQS